MTCKSSQIDNKLPMLDETMSIASTRLVMYTTTPNRMSKMNGFLKDALIAAFQGPYEEVNHKTTT